MSDTSNTPHPAAELGELFRSTRQSKGFSIGEVAERLKLTPHQITALEQGNHDGLPEAIYVRGFVRSYARFLGLEEETVNPYLQSLFGTDSTPRVRRNEADKEKALKFHERPVKKPFPVWIVMLAAAIILVGAVSWWQKKSAQHNQEQAQEQSNRMTGEVSASAPLPGNGNVAVMPLPAASAPASAADTATASGSLNAASAPASANTAAAGDLVINLRYRSMLTVMDSTGKVLFNGIAPGRTAHAFNGTAPYNIRIGYSDGSTVSFKGQDVPLTSGQRSGHTVNLKVAPN